MLHTRNGESKNTLVITGLCFTCWDLFFEKYRESEVHLEYSWLDKNWNMPCDEWFILGMFSQRMNNLCYIRGYYSYIKDVLEKLDYLLQQNEGQR